MNRFCTHCGELINPKYNIQLNNNFFHFKCFEVVHPEIHEIFGDALADILVDQNYSGTETKSNNSNNRPSD